MSFFKKKKQTGSKIKEAVYVSKLGNKRSKPEIKNGVAQKKGVRKSIVQRYINIVFSDLNVIRSIWKPRVVYVKEEPNDTETLHE